MTIPLSDLTLRPATREEAIESRTRSYVEWGRSLSLDTYLNRDAIMDTLSFAGGGKMTTWVLAPRDLPSSHPFVCACETYRREASLVLYSTSSTPERVVSYGVASVFTPAEYRRQGYAAHMMRLLHRVLALPGSLPPFPVESWGAPPPNPGFGQDGLFSVLYSDVGENFYEAAGFTVGSKDGWSARSPFATYWKVDGNDEKEDQDAKKLKSLAFTELNALLLKDASNIESSLFPSLSSEKTHITLLPTLDQIEFLASRYTLTLPSHPLPLSPSCPVKSWGASIITSPTASQDKADDDEYAIWVPQRDESSLLIIRMRVSSPESLKVLVRAAKRAAKEHKLAKVELWNGLDGIDADPESLEGGVKAMRKEHLSALAWYGLDKVRKEDVVWELNEKFAWC